MPCWVAESAIASMQGELHRQEKAIVGFDLQVTASGDAAVRISRKQDQIAVERRTAEEELRAQEQREEEARHSIQRIETEQRAADEQLAAAQRKLFEARESAGNQARVTAEAKASHAALVERSSALAIEVGRLQEAGRELFVTPVELLLERLDVLLSEHVRGDPMAFGAVKLELPLVFAQLLERPRVDEHGIAFAADMEALRGDGEMLTT